MGVYETFSKRQKRIEQSNQADIYQYDELSDEFRMQVRYIWVDAIGTYESAPSMMLWDFIHETLARELGLAQLGLRGHLNNAEGCIEFLLKTKTTYVLDIIELSFRIIDVQVRNYSVQDKYYSKATIKADDAIDELNHRFREHGIGYQFDGGQLIKVSSQYIHAEIVKPAIGLLHEVKFFGAQEEFLRAHEHYRRGNYKEAITEALKAFESTMKALCSIHNWAYSPNDTASQLIKIMFDNELIPSMLQSQFAGLRSLLETGVPTVRNRTSGHGQGISPVVVPEYIAAYALHMAASNIVFLVEAHKLKK